MLEQPVLVARPAILPQEAEAGGPQAQSLEELKRELKAGLGN